MVIVISFDLGKRQAVQGAMKKAYTETTRTAEPTVKTEEKFRKPVLRPLLP